MHEMGRVEWKNTLLGEQTVPIVITGGTGCVGTAVITCLLERLPHVSIHVLDLVIPAQNDPRFVPGVAKYHQGDVTDLAAVLDIFSEVCPKAIVHSASLIPSAAKNLGVGNEGLEKVNIQGTENVLEAARAIGSVEAFVYTSSCDVVKPDPWVDLVNVTEEGTAHLVHSKQWRQKYPETKVNDRQWPSQQLVNRLIVTSSGQGRTSGSLR
jgi:nucleoside-diphosphate-sugar epimerase